MASIALAVVASNHDAPERQEKPSAIREIAQLRRQLAHPKIVGERKLRQNRLLLVQSSLAAPTDGYFGILIYFAVFQVLESSPVHEPILTWDIRVFDGRRPQLLQRDAAQASTGQPEDPALVVPFGRQEVVSQPPVGAELGGTQSRRGQDCIRKQALCLPPRWRPEKIDILEFLSPERPGTHAASTTMAHLRPTLRAFVAERSDVHARKRVFLRLLQHTTIILLMVRHRTRAPGPPRPLHDVLPCTSGCRLLGRDHVQQLCKATEKSML